MNNLYEPIERWKQQMAVALTDDQGEMTYIDLLEQTNSLCLEICESLSVTTLRGKLIGFELENDRHFLILFLAIQKLEGCAVPIDPALGQIEKKRFIDHIGFNQRYQINELKILIKSDDAFCNQGMIQLSSGSTGSPKGIVISHQALLARAKAIASELKLTASDRTLCAVPLSHSHGIDCLAMPTLIAGGRLTIKKMKFVNPIGILKTIEKQKITFFSSIPSFYQFVLQLGERKQFDLSSLKHPFCGSAALNPEIAPELKRRFGLDLKQGYGVAEIGVVCLNTHSCGVLDYQSVGKVIAGVSAEYESTDQPGRKLLKVVGSSMYSGYFENFNPNSTPSPIETGDIVTIDEWRRLKIVGRKLDFLNIRGIKVFPSEIENALTLHPNILEAGVKKGFDHNKQEIPLAYVVLKDSNRPLDLLAINSFLSTKLSDAKLVGEVFFCETLPKSPLGKLQRARL